jgi:hypothetical protein
LNETARAVPAAWPLRAVLQDARSRFTRALAHQTVPATRSSVDEHVTTEPSVVHVSAGDTCLLLLLAAPSGAAAKSPAAVKFSGSVKLKPLGP